MKMYFFTFITLLLLISCKKDVYKISNNSIGTQNVNFQEDTSFINLKSGKFSYKIPKSKLPFRRIILLNASLVGYVNELEVHESLIGVSSPEYIYSEKILDLIKKNKIQNVGNEQKYDVERIISLKPDAVFTNYIASFKNTYEVLKKNGIQVLFIDEYLEQKPLEKSKIIYIFGKLLGKESKAHSIYKEVERNYMELKEKALEIPQKPIILANEMYGNQWFMPGGRTQLSHFINDSGGDYILKENSEEKAVVMSFEEVFMKSENAKIWVNVGNHLDKKSLLSVNPNYAKMNVFKNGKIYGLTGREKNKSNDFFESGIVRSDLILKDYIKIIHPELLPNYKLYYLKELK